MTLLGPSGSGKSTILSMIAGLTAPSSGHIRIGGRDVTHVRPSQRNLGLVFQSYALFPHMSVFDNIAFPLSIRSLRKAVVAQRVGKALEQVRLTGLQGRRPSQLSGGQQQRVALARALVFEPEILLLDEPMGALDKKLREEVQLELRQLQRELGVTTALVTHDLEEALSLSTRLVVLNPGRMQQVDTPMGAYCRPHNRFVAGFIGTANRFEGQVEPGAGGASVVLAQGARCKGAVHRAKRPGRAGVPGGAARAPAGAGRRHCQRSAGQRHRSGLLRAIRAYPSADRVGCGGGRNRRRPAGLAGARPGRAARLGCRTYLGHGRMKQIAPSAWLILPLLLVMAAGFNLPLLGMLGQSLFGPAGFTLVHFREVFEASAYLKVLVFILTLGFFITLAVLGGGRVPMVANMLDLFVNQMPNWDLASAISTVLLVMILTLFVWYLRLTRVREQA